MGRAVLVVYLATLAKAIVRLAYEDPMTPHVGMVRNSGSILNATKPLGRVGTHMLCSSLERVPMAPLSALASCRACASLPGSERRSARRPGQLKQALPPRAASARDSTRGQRVVPKL